MTLLVLPLRRKLRRVKVAAGRLVWKGSVVAVSISGGPGIYTDGYGDVY